MRIVLHDRANTVSLTEFLKKAVDYGFVTHIMFGLDEMAWPGTVVLSVIFF